MQPKQKNKAETSSNKLSILVARDGLSFCASTESVQKITHLVEKKFESNLNPSELLREIEIAFEQSDMDMNKFDQVRVVFSNELYAFVPQAFFKEESLSNYLKFNTKILPTDFITYDDLTPYGMNNVYIPYANINNYFFEKFGSFEYRHANSVLAESLLKQEQKSGTEVYLHVYFKHFDMLVIQDGKMHLCNTFSYETPEDFIYYILFVAEQLKLDPQEFTLNFIGDLSEDSEHYKLCYTYVKNCAFYTHETALHNEFDLSNVTQKKLNFLLLKTHLCA